MKSLIESTAPASTNWRLIRRARVQQWGRRFGLDWRGSDGLGGVDRSSPGKVLTKAAEGGANALLIYRLGHLTLREIRPIKP